MRDELIAFLESLELSHFRPEEFLINTNRPGNVLPPRELWGNIALTAFVLDRVRAHFNRPAVITSCYRAPEYNRRIGGTPKSQHQAFTAIDFSIATVSARHVAEFCREIRGEIFAGFREFSRTRWGDVPFKEIENSRFIGGVGSYSNFTHIDTRGINATWRGN